MRCVGAVIIAGSVSTFHNATGMPRRMMLGIFHLLQGYGKVGALNHEHMGNDEKITKALYAAVDDLNEQGVEIDKSLDAPLYSASGKLESLDFVTFITKVEDKINAEFGTDITIADVNLLSKEKSPFSSLRTLTEYLKELLRQEDSGAT